MATVGRTGGGTGDGPEGAPGSGPEDGPAGGRAAFAAAARSVRTHWPRHLAAHLLAAALGALLLWPLFVVLRDRLVRLSGDSAVADFGIAAFLLTPAGLVSLFALGAALIALAVFETAAMMTIAVAARRARPPGAAAALRFVLGRVPALLGFGLGLTLRLAVPVLPGLAVAALIGWRFLTDHDINYYLAFRPPEFRTAAWLIGLVALGTGAAVLVLLLRWALALPLVLFGETPPRAAFGRSAALMRQHRGALVPPLAVWAAASLALTLGAGALVYGIGQVVVPEPDAPLGRLALALGLTGALFLVVQVAVQTFRNATFATLLAGAALHAAPELLTRPLPGTDPGGRPAQGLPAWFGAIGLAGLVAAAGIAGTLHALGGLAAPGGQVEVIAHRAGAAAAPENTLAAVRRTLAEGAADWLEIDVQETADGTVVVIHDRDLMRQAGLAREVHLLTPGEVAQTDIGSWFGAEFAGERLATLDAVLAEVKGRARLLIELKHYGHAVRLEERVIEAVEAAGMEAEVAVMSLDGPSIARMRALRPDWPAGLLLARVLGDPARLEADFLAVNAALARPALVRHARAAGKTLHVWTLNDAAGMRAMLLRGVDGLITDRPALAAEVRAEMAALPPRRRALLALGTALGLAGGG